MEDRLDGGGAARAAAGGENDSLAHVLAQGRRGVYVRDRGIVHALLKIRDQEALLGHSASGMSWEGFVIENLIGAAPRDAVPLYYRTERGAEIDLLLEMPEHGLWAVEIQQGLPAKPGRDSIQPAPT